MAKHSSNPGVLWGVPKAARLVVCVVVVALAAMVGVMSLAENAHAEDDGVPTKKVRILFTHDIHSNLDVTQGHVGDRVREYGGAARLATLLATRDNGKTIYLDAGDFSQGTMYQAGYLTDAYELRTLGRLGCSVTTLGNHEWDGAGKGLAQMLRSALASGDPLPDIVQSNLDFSGQLTEEQLDVRAALQEYGVKNYVIKDVGGVKLAIFGLSGEESIEDSPTSGMKWTNYIEAAKQTVAEIGDQADVVVCLSHAGTSGDGDTGEDFELIKEVPGIDVIISGHSHTAYERAIVKDGTILCSAGEYLKYLGTLSLSIDKEGKVSYTNYDIIPIDETVTPDLETAKMLEGFKEKIASVSYLEKWAPGASFDEVIAYSPFSFMSLEEMYATHQEYPMGDLIADSYLYEAHKNGIDDIDVALVGLGTIRGSFAEGDITTADAFNICSLGVGADGSAGHPLLSAYITGKELKLLVSLDASLGPLVSSIKMSYSGLEYTFNTARVPLDQVTEVHLVRPDGSTEDIEDDKLYKVCCNMYAANMLGMLNGLTMGILAITPKAADGSTIEDFYSCELQDKKGLEIKEWVAFRDYLMSFDKIDGVSTIPAKYSDTQNRKVKVNEGGAGNVLSHPGTATVVVCAVAVVLALIIVLIGVRHWLRHKRKKAIDAEIVIKE